MYIDYLALKDSSRCINTHVHVLIVYIVLILNVNCDRILIGKTDLFSECMAFL